MLGNRCYDIASVSLTLMDTQRRTLLCSTRIKVIQLSISSIYTVKNQLLRPIIINYNETLAIELK